MKRIILLAFVAALAAACGDNLAPPAVDPQDDAAPPEIDAGVDAAPVTTSACLDRPTDLQRPPTGQLPCELIPPGLTINP